MADDFKKISTYRYFKNEESLIKELIEHLNSQYEYVADTDGEAVYYDWIYWVLDKLDEMKEQQ